MLRLKLARRSSMSRLFALDSAELVLSSLPPSRLNMAAVATGERSEVDNHVSVLVLATVGAGKSSASSVEVLVVHAVPKAAAASRNIVDAGADDEPPSEDGSLVEFPTAVVGHGAGGEAENGGGGRCENGGLHSCDVVRGQLRSVER